MSDLLIEVGCEELPAHSVTSACEQLANNLRDAIQASHLDNGSMTVQTAATPRRLIVGISGLLSNQADRVEQRRGPGAKAAFGEDGSPTPALQGFCRGAGVTPEQVSVEGDYVWANVSIKGRAALDVLAEDVPKAIQAISFDKTMRWGSGRMRFARPIRWIVATIDGAVIQFTLEEIASGNLSRGHRFLNNDSFAVSGFEQLIGELRNRGVLAETDERVSEVVAELDKVGVTADANDPLVLENAQLVEKPNALVGEFRNEFLTLPDCVLIETMKKHLRFFPFYDGDRITNKFASITNGKVDDTVRRGNEWVLNARFNDAKFFFEEDKKRTLSEFLELTARIMFQEKLGTIRQRADRLSALAERIALAATGSDSLANDAKQAGLFCKADLSTGLVSELASLQGKVGGEYAKRENLSENVWRGIYSHYQADASANADHAKVSLFLQCADAADRLAGFLHIGQKPTGSSDPYALRRAMSQLVEAQLESPVKASVWDWLCWAGEEYRKQGFAFGEDAEIENEIKELVWARYEIALSSIALDARQSAWETGWNEPSARFAKRAEVIAKLSSDTDFVRTAKRPGNIVAAAEKKGIVAGEVDERLLVEDCERELFRSGVGLSSELTALAEQEKFAELADRLRSLSEPIRQFFDAVMVMVDDVAVRDNRLGLLRRIDSLFRLLGDFDKIVIEGEK